MSNIDIILQNVKTKEDYVKYINELLTQQESYDSITFIGNNDNILIDEIIESLEQFYKFNEIKFTDCNLAQDIKFNRKIKELIARNELIKKYGVNLSSATKPLESITQKLIAIVNSRG